MDGRSGAGVAPGLLIDLLDELVDTGTVRGHNAAHGRPVDAGDVRELREGLEIRALRAVDALGDRSEVLPLRLPKGRLLDLSACQRFALSSLGAGRGRVTPRMLAGIALDRFVVHEVAAGPVADPFDDLASMLEAEDEAELLEDLQASGREVALAPLATAARAFAGVDDSWWPRTQSGAGVELAGGAVVSTGRVDLELGGPLADRPGVVVEVKASGLGADHLAEVRHYALLVALRDGVAPRLALCWSPPGSWTVELVTPGVLESAARRLGDAVEAWAGLLGGATPTESAGPRCRRCPESDRCPSVALSPSGASDDA